MTTMKASKMEHKGLFIQWIQPVLVFMDPSFDPSVCVCVCVCVSACVYACVCMCVEREKIISKLLRPEKIA